MPVMRGLPHSSNGSQILNAQLAQARSDVDNARLEYEALLELRLAEVRRTRDAARPVS